MRINSLEIARAMPDFGGRASGDNFSLLPHQDHLDPDGDPRRFLMLTKHADGARGSSTLIISPAVAARMLPFLETWVTDDARRELIGTERCYDRRFHISRQEYDKCFDEQGGYERAVASIIGSTCANPLQRLSVRLGILGYLIRGSRADAAMGEIVENFGGEFYEERWERGGVVIIDNPLVFHARLGGNDPPLQRNFGT